MAAGNFLQRLLGIKPAPAPRAPEDATVYAIGDVHGRADLLRPLLEAVQKDAEGRGGRRIIVFLGDFIDRGPGSRDVVDQVLAVSGAGTFETHSLRGNHDEALLDFLRDPATGPVWCDFGGRDTLQSYGVQPPLGRTDLEGWANTSAALGEALPSDHRRFFETLEVALELGDYFFAHAGARPGVPLDEQSERDLLWIREPFLSDTRRFEKVVVHGHTPTEAVHLDRRRIGLDTGAYATGVLTAIRLEGETQTLIQTRRGEGRSWEASVLDALA
jgi:serine/threonine protein phosphatase 1